MSEQYRPVSQAYLIKALRQAEAELARVTAERDAAMLFVSRWLDGASLATRQSVSARWPA